MTEWLTEHGLARTAKRQSSFVRSQWSRTSSTRERALCYRAAWTNRQLLMPERGRALASMAYGGGSAAKRALLMPARSRAYAAIRKAVAPRIRGLTKGYNMGKKHRDITTNTMPNRTCPHCGAQVVKTIHFGQLSYDCRTPPCNRWGPWEESLRKLSQSGAEAQHG